MINKFSFILFVVCLNLFFASRAYAAISGSPIQQKTVLSAGSSISITLNSTPTNGNTLILFGGNGDTTVHITGISETGVTWQVASATHTNKTTEIWYGTVGSSPSASITVTLSGTPSSTFRGGISEWSGILTSGALDAHSGNNGSSNAPTTAVVTPTASQDELIIANAGGAGNLSAPTNGFTALTTQDVGDSGSYLVVTNTSGTYSTAWSSVASGVWETEIATFSGGAGFTSPTSGPHSGGAVLLPPNNLGLVGYWPMNAGNGTRADDYSGDNNDGIFVGTPTWIRGRVGDALNFVAASSQGLTLNTSPTTGTGSFSIFGWIKTSTTGTRQSIVNYGTDASGAGHAVYLYVNTSNEVEADVTSGTGPTSSAPVTDGTWHYVGVVNTAGSFQIYVDGVASGSSVSLSPNITGSAQAAIGYFPSVGDYFNGDIDEVRVYNRAVSYPDVLDLYQNNSKYTNVDKSPVVISNGLVGWWPLDGKDTDWGAGTTNDDSGSGNTGNFLNLSTTTSPVVGKVGQALNFPLNGEVDVPDSSSIDLGSIETIAFWVKGTPSTSFGELIRKTDDATTGWDIQNNNTGGNEDLFMRIDTSGGSGQTCGTLPTVLNGSWHHVVFVINNGTCTPYKDGVIGTGGTYTVGGGFSNPTHSLIMGSSVKVSDTLDDVRIYNRALSGAEISQLYGATQTTIDKSHILIASGLVGWWPFDGKDTNWASGVTNDDSGHGDNGVVVNMATGTAPVIGKIGQALTFNGTNSYVNVPTFPTATNPLSISAWVYPTSLGQVSFGASNGGTIIEENESGGTSGWVFGVRSSGLLWFWPSSGNDKFSTGAILINTWNYVVSTYNGTNLTLYINGVLDSSQAMVTPQGSATFFKIGAEAWTTGAWKGKLDDVRVYNRILSQSEVTMLYRQGK